MQRFLLVIPFLACFVGCAAPPTGTWNFKSAFRAGDPLAMALHPDESRAYLVEGSELVVVDLRQSAGTPPPVIARVDLDLSVVSMFATEDRLYIAAGSSGLWVMELNGTLGRIQPPMEIDNRDGSVCTAVCESNDQVLACFAAKGQSTLRVYRKGNLVKQHSIRIPRGLPFAVAVLNDAAYLALGAGGLARVVGLDSDSPSVEWGPPLDSLPVPKGFRLRPGFARDLAIGGGNLYVAADASGLIRLDLGDPWSTKTAVHNMPFSPPGATYAARVDTQAGGVVAGYGRGPAEGIDGAPYSSYGRFGAGLEAGGIHPGDFVTGRHDYLVVWDWLASQERQVVPIPKCGWRELVLGGKRIYSMHHMRGFQVRDRRVPEPVQVERRNFGYPAVDGRTSLVDPNLVLFGQDSGGALPIGWVRRDMDTGALNAIERMEWTPSLGLQFDAQWLDEADPSCEWIVGGYGFHWTVTRIEHGDRPKITQWILRVPIDAEGETGDTYFNSSVHKDLLLLSCVHTRFGVLGYRTSDVVEAAKRAPAGGALPIEPAFRVETHSTKDGIGFAYRSQVIQIPDGRAIALVGTGGSAKEPDRLDDSQKGQRQSSHTDQTHDETRGPSPADGPKHHGALLLFDVSYEATRPPTLLSIVDAKGEIAQSKAGSAAHVIAVQACPFEGRVLAIVGDLAGNISIYDITEPEAPTPVSTWTCPPNPFDGEPESVLDLEILFDPLGHPIQILAALGRRGVVLLDMATLRTGLRATRFLETPGWAAGLFLETRGGTPRLFVGDQKAGLRLYEFGN